MKFALATVFAAVVSARKLEQNAYNQAQEYDETSFLQNYEQVFLKCVPNMKVMNEQGEADYNAVVYRMCPTGTACANGKVCSEGSGDYVVGLKEYVQNFFEQFEDDENNNGQVDDQEGYDFGEFGECRELNVENDDENNNGQEVQYFMGPACTEGGDVRMALFTDEYCRPEYEASVTLEELIGIEMPYQNGGLMDDDECKAYYCYAMNENGEYELNRFCEELYMASAYKCETDMEYTSAVNGMNEYGCETISELMPKSESKGGMIFLVILLVVVVVGAAAYFVMQKKKQGTSEGLMM